MNLHIFEADLESPRDSKAIVEILNSYASDPAGLGKPLSQEVMERLIPGLRGLPNRLVLLAESDGSPVGLAVCFFGYSTFHARPLLNIHDLAVLPGHRGKGVGQALLREIERRARAADCCRLTLEVQDDNRRARAIYERYGFTDFSVGDAATTRFLAKPLSGPVH